MGCELPYSMETRKLPSGMTQRGLIQAILNELHRCGIKGNLHYRYINAVIDASNRVCNEFARETIIAPPGSGMAAWIDSDEVGASSLFLARTLADAAGIECPPHKYPHENRYPGDMEDFRRCVQMLDAVPQLRAYIKVMKHHGPAWERLSDKWAELEILYVSERSKARRKKTFALLRECVQ